MGVKAISLELSFILAKTGDDIATARKPVEVKT